MDRRIRPHHCKYCAETRPEEFYKCTKSQCRKCLNKNVRGGPDKRIPLPHACECGESDPSKFYGTRKNKCRACANLQAKGNYSKLTPDLKERYHIAQDKWRRANIFNQRCHAAKARSERKGLEFDLTPDVLRTKYEEQDGKCFYSGIDLSLECGTRSDKNYSLSIERINPAKGYTVANTVLLCNAVNNMKNSLKLSEFVSIIKKIHETMC